MKRRHAGGFTVVELIIVVSVLLVLALLVFPAFVNTLSVVNRENAQLNMFRTAEAAVNSLTSTLHTAILPMVTGPDACSGAGAFIEPPGPEAPPAVNSEHGFRKNGCRWRLLFTRGTEYIPYCVPVPYMNTQSTVDKDDLPILGIATPDGRTFFANRYSMVAGESAAEKNIQLQPYGGGKLSIHPYFAETDPTELGVDPLTLSSTNVNLEDAIYSEDYPTFFSASPGFAVIRFVPFRERPHTSDPGYRILSESKLQYDINENGSMTDTFVLGRLEATYPAAAGDGSGRNVRQPLTPNTVLLQMNREGSPTYEPMFRLVGYGDPDNSPLSQAWDGKTDDYRGGYALCITLLLFDELSRESSLLRHSAASRFVAKKFQTIVELRAMTP